ncbi:MAG: hypothetical protein ABL929_03450 [Ferruginibacter sp.]|nr:hypothetical protein [Ferruginibacter sp.]
MAAISKAFAKAIIKKRKINDWDNQFNASGFYDTAFVEFSKVKLIELLNSLGSDVEDVRIYLAKYPSSEENLVDILDNKLRTPVSDKEKTLAKSEFANYIGKNKYESHSTLVFVGVDKNGKELFENSGNKILTISTTNRSIENHGELRPPNPPTDIDTLYDETYN